MHIRRCILISQYKLVICLEKKKNCEFGGIRTPSARFQVEHGSTLLVGHRTYANIYLRQWNHVSLLAVALGRGGACLACLAPPPPRRPSPRSPPVSLILRISMRSVSALIAQCLRFRTKTSTSPVRLRAVAIPRKTFFLDYIYLRVVGWPYLKNSHAFGQCSRSSMLKVWNKNLNVAGSSPDGGDTEKNIFLGLVSPASELNGFILRFPMRTVGRHASRSYIHIELPSLRSVVIKPFITYEAMTPQFGTPIPPYPTSAPSKLSRTRPSASPLGLS